MARFLFVAATAGLATLAIPSGGSKEKISPPAQNSISAQTNEPITTTVGDTTYTLDKLNDVLTVMENGTVQTWDFRNARVKDLISGFQPDFASFTPDVVAHMRAVRDQMQTLQPGETLVPADDPSPAL